MDLISGDLGAFGDGSLGFAGLPSFVVSSGKKFRSNLSKRSVVVLVGHLHAVVNRVLSERDEEEES